MSQPGMVTLRLNPPPDEIPYMTEGTKGSNASEYSDEGTDSSHTEKGHAGL